MSGKMLELGRLSPADGASVVVGLPDDLQTVIVWNALTAPLYGRWGETPADPSAPTATVWDTVAPGSAICVIPIPPGSQTLRLVVDYPGAVPVADVQAVVSGSPCAWAPFVGPLDS